MSSKHVQFANSGSVISRFEKRNKKKKGKKERKKEAVCVGTFRRALCMKL